VRADRDLAFLQVLWALDHGLQTMSKKMEANLGVTGPQRTVIRTIGRNPDISAGEIAEQLRLHPSTVTGILQRLEARGRIERRQDPGDRRRALFRLTEDGKTIHRLRAGTVEGVVSSVLAHADPAQVEATTALLQELSRALDAAADPER
jgi:DNA-binding MarR family transcriptional regulator